MNRFGRLRVPIVKRFAVPQIKKRALNSLTAVQDTYYSIKDTFERHKVVFTISTSVASVATAWLGLVTPIFPEVVGNLVRAIIIAVLPSIILFAMVPKVWNTVVFHLLVFIFLSISTNAGVASLIDVAIAAPGGGYPIFLFKILKVIS
ncbi:hypothetical protein AgCh_003629 [Apium graveolens]